MTTKKDARGLQKNIGCGICGGRASRKCDKCGNVVCKRCRACVKTRHMDENEIWCDTCIERFGNGRVIRECVKDGHIERVAVRVRK